MQKTKTIVILHFDDYTGNKAFVNIKGKYQERDIKCHSIKLPTDIPETDGEQKIRVQDIHWPDDINLDENTSVIIIGHARPGTSSFSSDKGIKLYSEAIVQILKTHLIEKTKLRIQLVACCAAIGGKDKPEIDLSSFDYVNDFGLSTQLSEELKRSHINYVLSSNTELMLVTKAGNLSTVTLPMHFQKHWDSYHYRLVESTKYSKEDKDLKYRQYRMMGMLREGFIMLKRPNSKVKIDSADGIEYRVKYDNFSHFTQPYMDLQTKWLKDMANLDKFYRDKLDKKFEEVLSSYEFGDLHSSFIQSRDYIAEKILIADPGMVSIYLRNEKFQLEQEILVLEAALLELKPENKGKPSKHERAAFEHEEDDDIFSVPLSKSNYPDKNCQKIKELEDAISKARKTFDIFSKLEKSIEKESENYTEEANKMWQVFITKLSQAEKQAMMQYRKHKPIIQYIEKTKLMLSQMSEKFDPGLFPVASSEKNKNMQEALTNIQRSFDEPIEKITKVRRLFKESPKFMQKIADDLDVLERELKQGDSPTPS